MTTITKTESELVVQVARIETKLDGLIENQKSTTANMDRRFEALEKELEVEKQHLKNNTLHHVGLLKEHVDRSIGKLEAADEARVCRTDYEPWKGSINWGLKIVGVVVIGGIATSLWLNVTHKSEVEMRTNASGAAIRQLQQRAGVASSTSNPPAQNVIPAGPVKED